jgi:aerobic-type carbon monoxide dehydrogenase small subunit (CoxS/CutS family)
MQVRDVAGKNLVTIEGIGKDGKLHPVQQAFIDHDAFQCGFCTSGMILEAVAFVEKNSHPSRDAIQQGLNGHLCRCGAYQSIIEAVQSAAKVVHRG